MGSELHVFWFQSGLLSELLCWRRARQRELVSAEAAIHGLDRSNPVFIVNSVEPLGPTADFIESFTSQSRKSCICYTGGVPSYRGCLVPPRSDTLNWDVSCSPMTRVSLDEERQGEARLIPRWYIELAQLLCSTWRRSNLKGDIDMLTLQILELQVCQVIDNFRTILGQFSWYPFYSDTQGAKNCLVKSLYQCLFFVPSFNFPFCATKILVITLSCVYKFKRKIFVRFWSDAVINAYSARVVSQSSLNAVMFLSLSQTGVLPPRHHGDHSRSHHCVSMQGQRHLWPVRLRVVLSHGYEKQMYFEFLGFPLFHFTSSPLSVIPWIKNWGRDPGLN